MYFPIVIIIISKTKTKKSRYAKYKYLGIIVTIIVCIFDHCCIQKKCGIPFLYFHFSVRDIQVLRELV
jgi:hypothetical protein